MDRDEALRWLDKVAAQKPSSANRPAFTAWAVEGEGLFSRVFVPSDAVLLRYRAAVDLYMGGSGDMIRKAQSVVGAFQACSTVLKDHPAAETFWKVQVAGSGELLEQGEEVLTSGRSPAAAVVLAGGALEQHLLHLCQCRQSKRKT
jgi:hypothetical protein